MLKFRLIITYELILKLIGFIPNQLNGHWKIFFRNLPKLLFSEEIEPTGQYYFIWSWFGFLWFLNQIWQFLIKIWLFRFHFCSHFSRFLVKITKFYFSCRIFDHNFQTHQFQFPRNSAWLFLGFLCARNHIWKMPFWTLKISRIFRDYNYQRQ